MNRSTICTSTAIGSDGRRTTSWFQSIGGSAVGLLRAGIRRFIRWREWRRTYRALQALDNGALKDLGLNRSEIPYLAQSLSNEAAAWREIK
ncbi:MAG: DUF1127 domain-containing protein [Candidatus Competibacteraceae bacterium]